jgi:hypothetical protein
MYGANKHLLKACYGLFVTLVTWGPGWGNLQEHSLGLGAAKGYRVCPWCYEMPAELRETIPLPQAFLPLFSSCSRTSLKRFFLVR